RMQSVSGWGEGTPPAGEESVDAWGRPAVDTDPTAEPTVQADQGQPASRAERRRRRKDERRTRSGRSHPPEWVVLFAVAIVVALVIKTFLFQAFYIPSESMVPTLKVGDRVLVNKLSYDLHSVHRGDIVVFKAPPEAQTGGIKDLVKRVIG